MWDSSERLEKHPKSGRLKSNKKSWKKTRRLEEQGAGERCGILPGRAYVRVWADKIQSQTDRERTDRQVTQLERRRQTQSRKGDKAWSSVLHDSAALKTSNSVVAEPFHSQFPLKVWVTYEAVSHRMIGCVFTKRRCVVPTDSIIASVWRQT